MSRQVGSSLGVLPALDQGVAGWAQVHMEGTFAVWGSDGISAVTDNGPGDITFTWSRAFRSASSYVPIYCTTATAGSIVTQHAHSWDSVASGSAQAVLRDYNAASSTDPDMFFLAVFGEF